MTTDRPTIYVTDQFRLTRHVVRDFFVSEGGQAWLETACGECLADHGSVNITLTVSGWWVGCEGCGAPTSRPDPIGPTSIRNYLD